MVRVTPGTIAKWDTRESKKMRQGATQWCEVHGETPTAQAHRRVVDGARRWFFSRYNRRGIRVFRLRDFGRRVTAARFSGGGTHLLR
jgi:hypothetical protein